MFCYSGPLTLHIIEHVGRQDAHNHYESKLLCKKNIKKIFWRIIFFRWSARLTPPGLHCKTWYDLDGEESQYYSMIDGEFIQPHQWINSSPYSQHVMIWSPEAPRTKFIPEPRYHQPHSNLYISAAISSIKDMMTLGNVTPTGIKMLVNINIWR